MDTEPKNKNILRHDESFVINSLASFFDGQWSVGENPPDAYLEVNEERIAVEISTLSQHVSSSQGGMTPRLSEDATGIRICEELNNELHDNIPPGITILLTLNSPIQKARKTKKALAEKLLAIVNDLKGTEHRCELEILGNKINVLLFPEDRPSAKKIIGLIPNSKSIPDILLNAKDTLADRLKVKTEKCKFLKGKGALWLALLNDYWLASEETYQNAYTALSIVHPFEKVLLVTGDGSITELLHEET